MSAARLALALSAVAAGAFFGCAAAEHGAGRLDETRAFLSGLREAERVLRLERLPLGSLAEFIEGLAPCGPLPNMLRLISEGKRSLAESLTLELIPEARCAVSELVRGLGTGDIEAETSRLREASERLAPIVLKAREEHEKSSRLKAALSVMLGVGAALTIL